MARGIIEHAKAQQVTCAAEITGGTHQEVTYPTMEALLLDASGPSEMPIEERAAHQRSSTRDEFTGTRSFEEALAMARHGWTEGERIIADLSDRLEERVHRALPWYGMELAESGGEVDVAALLDGQRENMWDWREGGGRKPVVRINVNAAVHNRITTQEVQVMGAAIVALIDALERMGRRVELELFWPTTAYKDGAEPMIASARVRIKEADDPMHVANLAFALAHASMYRRILFSWMERYSKKGRERFGVGSGYGLSKLQLGKVTDDEIFVDVQAACERGVVDGYDFVMRQLRDQGIEVNEE